MAYRTTGPAVQAVLMRDYAAGASLTPFIRAANLLTSRVNTLALQRGFTLTAAELYEIETWLAAHYYCCSDQPYKQKSTANASGTFQGLTGYGLNGTKYGQVAQQLDPSGALTNLGGDDRQAAVLNWIGTPYGEQQDYWERNWVGED